MTWTSLALGPTDSVLVTVTKTTVLLALQPAVLRAVGWSEDEPNLSVALGSGEHAGWLRLALDEDGVTAEINASGAAALALPRSALPDLLTCRRSPVAWRSTDGSVEVRLPTIGISESTKSNRGRPALVATKPADGAPSVDLIAIPDLYKALHASAWAAGVELAFLSDGNCLVNGKIVTVDAMESLVAAAIGRASAANARAA